MTKSVQERVEELEARYKLVADNLVDAIWIMDIDTMTYDFVTPSVEKLSGYTAEEHKSIALRQRMTPQAFESLIKALEEEKRLLDTGVDHKRTVEVQMINKSGRDYWIEITARLFRDQDGRLKAAGITRDINKRRQAEQEREDLIRQLGQALAEKDILLKENKLLKGLLPICAGCKRIRDEQGRWWPLEAYVESHTDAQFTHTVCDECRDIYYGKNGVKR